MNEKKPLLSILITTYNRADFLDRCLAKIFSEIKNISDKIEVVVFNNGSNDNTWEIIKKYKKIYPSLKIDKAEKNLTFFGGLLKVFSLGSGEYGWFLGDDEIVLKNIFKSILNILENNKPDLITLNHKFYIQKTINDKIKYVKKSKKLINSNKNFFSNYKEYIKNVNHINGLFSHISGVIFKRELFKKNFNNEIIKKYEKSQSQHVAVFLSILKKSKKIFYLDKEVVCLRIGAPPYEDWYSHEGRKKRILMSSKYFVKMFEDVFDEKELIYHYKNLILKNDIFVLIIGAKLKMRNPNFYYFYQIFKMLKDDYKNFPFFWYYILPVLFTPASVFKLIFKFIVKR